MGWVGWDTNASVLGRSTSSSGWWMGVNDDDDYKELIMYWNIPNILKAQAAFTLLGQCSLITEHKSSISSNERQLSFWEENTWKIRSLKGLYWKTK